MNLTRGETLILTIWAIMCAPALIVSIITQDWPAVAILTVVIIVLTLVYRGLSTARDRHVEDEITRMWRY